MPSKRHAVLLTPSEIVVAVTEIKFPGFRLNAEHFEIVADSKHVELIGDNVRTRCVIHQLMLPAEYGGGLSATARGFLERFIFATFQRACPHTRHAGQPSRSDSLQKGPSFHRAAKNP